MITKDEFENIALLSKLYVAEDEYTGILDALQQMMDFAREVSEAEVKNNEATPCEYTPLREDIVAKSLEREAVLSNAKLCKDGCFKAEKKD